MDKNEFLKKRDELLKKRDELNEKLKIKPERDKEYVELLKKCEESGYNIFELKVVEGRFGMMSIMETSIVKKDMLNNICCRIRCLINYLEDKEYVKINKDKKDKI